MKKIMLKVDYTCNLRDKEGRAKYWADSYVKNLLVCVNDGESVHDVVKKVLEDKDCATCAKRFKPECEMFETRWLCENKCEVGGDDKQIFNVDRKSTRLNSSHSAKSRMPSSA